MHANLPVFLRMFSVVLAFASLPGCGKSQTAAPRGADQSLSQLAGIAMSGMSNTDVVHQIAVKGKGEAVGYLARIAISPIAARENRITAIDELVRIGNPDAVAGVADVLAPHDPIDVREHAAKALVNSNCTERCLKAVLTYLYRVSSGETSLREQSKLASVRTEFVRQQQGIVDTLREVLCKHERETITILVTMYGLGTEEPSRFAVDTVGQLQLRQACDLLIQSEDYQQKLSKIAQSNPSRTAEVIRELKCRNVAE